MWFALGIGTTTSNSVAQGINEGGLVIAEQSAWEGLAYVVIATVLLLVSIWLVRRIRVWLLRKLEGMVALPGGISETRRPATGKSRNQYSPTGNARYVAPASPSAVSGGDAGMADGK